MIFFFYGDNSYEIAQALSKIRAQYEKKTGGMLDVQSFDMSSTALSELLNAIGNVPMFADSRLLVVRGLSANKTASGKIPDIIKFVPDSTVVVLIDAEIDRRSSYYKTLSKLPNAREFTPLEPVKMRTWITDKVRELGGEIDSLNVQKLYERICHDPKGRDRMQLRQAGADQWQLEQEIIKLVSYDPKITSETIDLLVIGNVEQTIFTLVDAVTRGQSVNALRVYQNLIEHGASDQQILAMLNWQYRNIVLARENLGGGSEWMHDFGISPYVASKSANLSNSMDFAKIRASYKLMVEADRNIKTGARDSHLALEELIYKLAS